MEAGCELQASGDLTPANGPRVPLDRRPSGTQCLSDVLENRLSLLSLLGTDIRFLGRPARSTTAIPTQLPRLPQRVETRHVSFPTTACHQIIHQPPARQDTWHLCRQSDASSACLAGSTGFVQGGTAMGARS
jgi:hypothetical protein